MLAKELIEVGGLIEAKPIGDLLDGEVAEGK